MEFVLIRLIRGATTNDKDLSVIMNIHRGLYGWDAEKNEVRLEIAESVKVSDDGRTYTFTLRDVKFPMANK